MYPLLVYKWYVDSTITYPLLVYKWYVGSTITYPLLVYKWYVDSTITYPLLVYKWYVGSTITYPLLVKPVGLYKYIPYLFVDQNNNVLSYEIELRVHLLHICQSQYY